METKNLIKRPSVIHENFTDDSGKVYCRLQNKIVTLDWNKCDHCPLLGGGAQGMGVECVYDDLIDKNLRMPYINEPKLELLRISELIDLGLITKEPERADM